MADRLQGFVDDGTTRVELTGRTLRRVCAEGVDVAFARQGKGEFQFFDTDGRRVTAERVESRDDARRPIAKLLS